MTSVVEQKNETGYRTVVHLPGAINCTNCYLTKSCPCNKCSELDYETKRWEMSWGEFKSSVDQNVLMVACGNRMPNSYTEFCDFYDENITKSVNVPLSLDIPLFVNDTIDSGEDTEIIV